MSYNKTQLKYTYIIIIIIIIIVVVVIIIGIREAGSCLGLQTGA